MFTRFDVLWVFSYEDTLSLAATLWLADVRLVFLGPTECLEIPIAV